MSIKNIHDALDILSSKDTILHLYGIKYSHPKSGTNYTSFDIHFNTKDESRQIVDSIVEYSKTIYTAEKVSINPYDAFNAKNSIDKLPITDYLIADNINQLLASLFNSDDSINITTVNCNAYAIKATYNDKTGSHKELYLFVNKKPTYNYKNKLLFKMHTNTLKKMDDSIFQFHKTFDMLLFNGTAYMPTKNFESLFNLEHTHQITCKKYVEELEALNIISNNEVFSSIARSGQNPRKFTSFSPSRLTQIQSTKGKKILKDKFKLDYDTKNKCYIIEDSLQAEHLITILCNKAHKDLFDDNIIYEVPSAHKMDL